MKDRAEGHSGWSMALGAIAAAVVGWVLIEGAFVVELHDRLQLSLASRFLLTSILDVLFGATFGFAFARWWYLVPVVGASLDLALMARGFATGGANLWPLAVGIRLVWMLVVLGAAFLGSRVRTRRHDGA